MKYTKENPIPTEVRQAIAKDIRSGFKHANIAQWHEVSISSVGKISRDMRSRSVPNFDKLGHYQTRKCPTCRHEITTVDCVLCVSRGVTV